ncbi:MAG: DUF4625 domain-containing protein [Paludibacter sp.]|nr:DUF4625 domain-containing protein [Paludibacter sp.]
MKLHIKSLFYTLLFLMVLSSCSDDEKSSPVIQSIEVGANNSKTCYAGADLHIEAVILAEGKIANIRVLIHQETEGEDAPAMKISSATESSTAWELDSTYTDVYANVKNTTFHEHVDIPSTAETGTYHLHLYVTDLEGNQTMVEEEFTVSAPIADGSAPTISISSAPTENQVFTTGDAITISGTITDIQGLAGVYIGLVSSDAGLDDASVSYSNTITVLHNHNFEDSKSYSFSASLTVGASTDNNTTPKSITWTSGDYYILVKAPGVDGEVGFSAHYPIKIQL